jgi:ribose transport system substrate-binding protein
LIETAVASKVDGIVLAPLDAKTMVEPVEKAVARGIPVVIIDSALESNKTVAYVATDNYHGGALAGERLAEVLNGQGKIILLRYAIGSASTEEREQGFIDAIKKFPNITYLSDNQYAGATSDSAQKVAQNLVTRFRGQVDGIFCPNESSTSGMLRALRDAGMLTGSP